MLDVSITKYVVAVQEKSLVLVEKQKVERRKEMGYTIVPGRGKVKTDNTIFGCGQLYTSKPSNTKPQSAYERTKAQVYATGNKWAIENFHATHD